MFDDFFSNIQEKASESFSNIGNVLASKAEGYVSSFLGFGEEPKSNPTAKQVQSGQRGAPVQGNVMSQGFMGIPMPALLIGGAAALALILKR